MDSTFLKAQQRGRAMGVPVSHFPMHLGLHYSGRERRYTRRASLSVKLKDKRWILSSRSMALFGRRLFWQRCRHFQGRSEVILSDGDEGLERVVHRFKAFTIQRFAPSSGPKQIRIAIEEMVTPHRWRAAAI